MCHPGSNPGSGWLSFRTDVRNLAFHFLGVTPGTDPGYISSAFHPANGCRIKVRHDKNGSPPLDGVGQEGVSARLSFRTNVRNLALLVLSHASHESHSQIPVDIPYHPSYSASACTGAIHFTRFMTRP